MRTTAFRVGYGTLFATVVAIVLLVWRPALASVGCAVHGPATNGLSASVALEVNTDGDSIGMIAYSPEGSPDWQEYYPYPTAQNSLHTFTWSYPASGTYYISLDGDSTDGSCHYDVWVTV
jgi:hypothetical protein